jgi:hypothetical protein
VVFDEEADGASVQRAIVVVAVLVGVLSQLVVKATVV